MLKVVLDTNIFVSAVLKPHSDLAKIFELVREDKIKLILSEDILSEIRAVLLYPKIKKCHRRTQKEIDEFLNKASQASILAQGRIDKVIVGADRIAVNGDIANKIGTYNLAVLCKYHKIPFYAAAPASTFDLRIKSGKDIQIEQRPAKEVTHLFFKKPIAGHNIKVFNPAFDVTPHELITAIITDKGIIKPPLKENISRILGNR